MIVLQGARERVDLLQFSPDGRLLVALCGARVQLWNELSAGSRPTAVLAPWAVWTVQFTPDGRKLLLGHVREHAQLGLLVHDLATVEATEVPLELPGRRVSFGLGPDGRSLIVAQIDFTSDPPVRLFCRHLADPATTAWSLPTRPIYEPPLFLPGGERFLVVEWQWRPQNGQIALFVTRDARTGQILAEVEGNLEWFNNPTVLPDRGLIACRRGGWVAVLHIDDLGAKPVLFRNDNRKEFTGLAFHPSGRYLAATSNDATVKLYDTSTWQVAHSFNWEIGRLRSVAFSPDGMLAAAGGDKGKIVVWDVDL
jgi:WD40 repeat protein